MTTPAAAPAAPAAAATPAPAASATPAAPAAAAAPAPAAAVPDIASLIPADPGAAPAAATPAKPAAPVDPNSPDAWVLMEGVQGTGPRPDYFLNDKYANLAEQAKAYPELAKRFGSFIGAPADGKYDTKLPESAGVELVGDHPLLSTFQDWAKTNNLSQKGFTELLGFLGQYESQHIVDPGAVKTELGENADARITAVAQWGKANLDDAGYKLLREATSGQEAVAVFKVLEATIAKTKQIALPGPGTDVPAGGANGAQAEIERMMQEKLPNGKPRYFEDAKFRQEVEAKRVALAKAA